MISNVFTIINKKSNTLLSGKFRSGEAILCKENHGIYVQLDSGIERFGGNDVIDNLLSTSIEDSLSAQLPQSKLIKLILMILLII